MAIEVKPLLIEISDVAADKIKQTISSQPQDDLFLRIYVQGGCGGISFGMALDNRGVDGDTEITYAGIRVVVDKNSLPYVTGSSVDFDETGEKAGFKITNPNSELFQGGGCGGGSCGTGGGCGSGSGGCC